MFIFVLVLVTSLSHQIREKVIDAGEAYIRGSRPPQSVPTSVRSLGGSPVSALRRLPDIQALNEEDPTLIIGDTPAETLVISGTEYHEGDILIMNDGTLIIEDAEFEMAGDFLVFGQGLLHIRNSDLAFDQEYIYHRSIIAAHGSNTIIEHSTVSSDGYPYNVGVVDSATITVDTVEYHDFTTASLFGNARIHERHVNLAGEFVMLDQSECSFVDVDTVLIWCSMMDSSRVDFAFPEPGPVYDWSFNESTEGVSGIEYEVYCDSVFVPWWGMFSGSGSDVTIRDSEIRTCGIFFENTNADTINGLVNGMTHSDYRVPLNDRTLRFVDTRVNTFSLYPWDQSSVECSASILGEVLSMERSFIFVQNYFLDGSGGHIEATDTSATISAFAMVTADAISRGNGFLVLVASSQLWGQNWATDQSRLFMVQTTTPAPPVAYDSSIVGFEIVTGPALAPVESVFPIEGSVWVDGGPLNDVDLAGYQVFYQKSEYDPQIPIGGEQYEEVRDGTLIEWDTTGLTPGNYSIIVRFYDTVGDTLDGFSLIRLDDIVPAESPHPQNLSLEILPGNRDTRFVIHLGSEGSVDLSIYNVAGRLVSRPISGSLPAGVHNLKADLTSSGAYIVRLKTDDEYLSKRFVFHR